MNVYFILLSCFLIATFFSFVYFQYKQYKRMKPERELAVELQKMIELLNKRNKIVVEELGSICAWTSEELHNEIIKAFVGDDRFHDFCDENRMGQAKVLEYFENSIVKVDKLVHDRFVTALGNLNEKIKEDIKGLIQKE